MLPVPAFFMSSSETTRQDLFPWKGTLAEKNMILDNPGPQKPEREYIRQNRPFTKPPFYLPVTCL